MFARRLLATLLALAAAPALAADPPPASLADLLGPRSMGLGASVGTGVGNDGLFVNPGATAARKRYSVEALLWMDRRGADTTAQVYGGSVVDALSSPVTMGFAYLRASKGAETGNTWALNVAGPVGDRLWLGAQARYLNLKGAERVDVVAADAGLYWEVGDWLSVGVAGYNLVPTGHDAVAPMGAGAGVAVGSDTSFKISLDWRGDFERTGTTTNRYAAGAEVLLGRLVPLRAGWVLDETLDTQWWSLGAGLIAPNGVAIDVAYRQSLDATDARMISVALKLFFLEL
jgi:hypothetical protein